MDRYCPECNSTMTPSLVGYLCPECGHMQRFYTSSMVAPAIDQDNQPAAPSPITTGTESQRIANQAPETAEQKKIRSTLKRLMVPELSPPHHEQLIAESSEPAQPTNSAVMPEISPLSRQIPADSVQEPQKHSKTWLWIVLSLFVFAVATLALLYFLVPKSS